MPQQTIVADVSIRTDLEESWLRSIAHDLRSSLFAARGYTKMVLEQREGSLAAADQRHLASALDSLGAMLGLVEELNDFPKVGALRLGRVNVTQLVQEAAAGARAVALDRRVKLLVPIGRKATFALGDQEQLATAVRIALMSAVHFTGVDGTVQAHLSEEEENLAVCFLSTGARDPEGPGPDLSLARQILRLHAGAVSTRRTLSGQYQVVCELPLLRSLEC